MSASSNDFPTGRHGKVTSTRVESQAILVTDSFVDHPTKVIESGEVRVDRKVRGLQEPFHMYIDESSLFLRCLRCRSSQANPCPPWLDGSHQLHDSSSLIAWSGPRAPRPPDPDPATCRNRAFGSPKPVGPPASYIVDEAEPPWFVIGDVGGKGPFRGGGGAVVGRSQRVESESAAAAARVVDERVMRAAGRPCKRLGGVKA